MPNVLQILPSLDVGGVEQGTIDMAAALVEAGWGSFVASAGGSRAHDLDRVKATHIKIKSFKSKNPITIWRNAQIIRQLIKKHKIDLVHVRSRAPAWSVAIALKDMKKPAVVTTFHGAYGASGLWKKKYNAAMLRGKRVIAVSHYIKEHILKTYSDIYPVPAEKIPVIPRGIDVGVFDPDHVSQARVVKLLTEWNIEPSLPIVMLPARLTHWKGHDVLIEACAWLKKEAPELKFQCLLVGSGRDSYQSRLLCMIQKMGLENIRFLPSTRDMPAAYMIADVVVVPSTKPEAFGRVVTEAQAMGRPVIAADHGGASETIIAGKTGFLTPPGDAPALGKAILEVLAMGKDARHKWGKAARAHVVKHYSKKHMTEQTLAVYKEILKIHG